MEILKIDFDVLLRLIQAPNVLERAIDDIDIQPIIKNETLIIKISIEECTGTNILILLD